MYVRNFFPKGRQKLVPTFVFGIGKVSIDDGSASESSTYLRFGGGSRFFVAPHIAIRVEAAMQRWRGQGDATPAAAFYSFDANVGVSFLFGGKSPVPAGVPDRDTKGEKKDDEP